MARFCPSCGAEVIEGAAFCAKCGKPISVPSAAQVPPAAAQAPAPAPSPNSTTVGLQDNVAGLLAYFFIPAIVFLFVEPYSRNKFVRFHSFQAIALGVIAIIVHAILAASVLGVFLFLIPFNLFWLVVSIICMIKAYQMQMFRLPVVGDFAEKQADA